MKHEETLKKITDAISAFLQENGGYHNGYLTYVEGTVCKGYLNKIDWSTPTVDNLTGKQYKKIGNKLFEEIKKIITDANLDHHPAMFQPLQCTITAKHIEHGCYETIVEVSERKRVQLL